MTVDGDPVLVVNSDKAITANQRKLDFEADRVWRILVGGTQLSRGFTVEGLTVSYFRRRTAQADTLMQAGRWFGFRPGYQDLVRLYIRRDHTVDLYEAFEALLLDEEAFREELRQYEGYDDDGRPLVEPRQIHWSSCSGPCSSLRSPTWGNNCPLRPVGPSAGSTPPSTPASASSSYSSS